MSTLKTKEKIVPEQAERQADYRELEPLAVVALVLAVASLVSVLNIYLAVVPLAAVLVALASLWRAKRSDRQKAGTGLATAALAISLLVGSFAISRYGFERQRMFAYAHRYCNQWLEYLTGGDVYTAHQLTMLSGGRVEPGTDLQQYYAENNVTADGVKPINELNGFLRLNLIKSLMNVGGGKLEFVRYGPKFAEPRRDIFDVIYRLTPEDPGIQPTVFALSLERRDFGGELGVQWRVTKKGNSVLSGPPQPKTFSFQRN